MRGALKTHDFALRAHKTYGRREKYGCVNQCHQCLCICSVDIVDARLVNKILFRAASHIRATPTLLLMLKTDGVGTASALDQLDGVARIWWWSAVLSTSDHTVSAGRDPN